MKNKRINYRALTIARFEEMSLMTLDEAKTFYNKVYRQALRQVKPEARKEFNMAREIYASSFYRSENVFTIDIDNQTFKLNKAFEGTSDIKQDITLLRMIEFEDKFAKESPALRRIFKDYRSGKISKSEFNANIKEWKKLNIKYMISGSK